MIVPGEIISYHQMCMEEGVTLQRGMNFKVNDSTSIILMSQRDNAPYADRIEEEGKILIYEGHDVPKNIHKSPKSVDQQRKTPKGKLTQNAKFELAALEFKQNNNSPELIKVYEKIKSGIWVFNGIFELHDSWNETIDGRSVFKFKLVITDISNIQKKLQNQENNDLAHNRIIPTKVKREVWKRDQGKCVQCGSDKNLHFDHILPFSKGGTSLKAENIQLLCAKHNLKKSNKII